MRIPWGNGWVLLAIALLIIIAAVILVPAFTPEKKKQKEYLVTIEATIEKSLSDDSDQKGGKHQRMFVRVTKVLDNPDRASVEMKRDILVAVRYGDENGLSQRLKALDGAVGKQIELRGKYIPKENLFGNKNHDVLHFTHKPSGYVRFANKTYR